MLYFLTIPLTLGIDTPELLDTPVLHDTRTPGLHDTPALHDTPPLHDSPALCLHLESDTDLSETGTVTAKKPHHLEAFYGRNLRSSGLRSPMAGIRSSATGCRPKRPNIVSEVKSFIPVKHVDQKKVESKEVSLSYKCDGNLQVGCQSK